MICMLLYLWIEKCHTFLLSLLLFSYTCTFAGGNAINSFSACDRKNICAKERQN